MSAAKSILIYHNPRCSKSRETLALIRDNHGEPQVIEYLKEPLSADELRRLIRLVGGNAHDLVRSKEEAYQRLGLSAESSDDEIIAAIVEEPKLLQRPIVVHGDAAVIGRPPQRVLDLF
jgi:arsenate reductase